MRAPRLVFPSVVAAIVVATSVSAELYDDKSSYHYYDHNDDVRISVGESALKALRYEYHGRDPKDPPPLCRPRRVHLSPGGASWSSTTVTFSIPRDCPVLDDTDDDDDDDVSIVLTYGERGATPSTLVVDGALRRKYATSYEYHRGGEVYRSDHVLHVPLRGLRASTKYKYRVTVAHRGGGGGGGGGGGRSSTPLLTFSTPPRPGGGRKRGTVVAIVADLGQTYNSTVTMKHMRDAVRVGHREGRPPASLVVCAGDLSYADTVQERWDVWSDLAEPLLSRVPFLAAPGNHEIERDDRGRVFLPFETRFRFPRARPARFGPGGGNGYHGYLYGNSFYDVVHGLAHLVFVNDYVDVRPGSEQYRWFVRTMTERVDRDRTPWVVVVAHNPVYNTFADHRGERPTMDARAHLEPLYVAHGVNVVVSGHCHAYVRTVPAAFGRPNRARGPVWLSVGEGGNREGHVREYASETPEPWVAARDKSEYGFGTIDFVNATTARWTWIRNEDDERFSFRDDAWLDNAWWRRHRGPGRERDRDRGQERQSEREEA